MREREPVTTTIKASEARRDWSQVLNKVFRRETRVIVEKSGIPVAAIISAQDLVRFNQLEEQRKRDLAVLDEIGQAFRDVPPEEIEDAVARALKEVREQRRRQQRAAATP